jgi:hypothetical protein
MNKINEMTQEEILERYKEIWNELNDMWHDGNENSEEAEQLRDSMEPIRDAMDSETIEKVKIFHITNFITYRLNSVNYEGA